MTVHNFGVETTLTTEQKMQALFRRLRPAAHQPSPAPAPTPAVGAGRPAREHLSRLMARRLAYIAKHHPEVYFEALENAGKGESK